VKRALIAVASGLALADAAVVTLALPQLLVELDTTVEGVAAVIAVYTAVLAVALPLSAGLHGRATGAAGALLFAAASIACASADSLELLLVARALQALGGAALLAAAFDALDGGASGRRLWLGAAVAGTAAGPALGGALTELFDWRAIFVAQAPIALAAAPALLAGHVPRVREVVPPGAPPPPAREEVPHVVPPPRAREEPPRPPRDILAAVALALLSGALTAVLFLLVLLLISGWSVEPLAAAAAVSVLPVAAVAGSMVRGPAATRAVAGCLLVAGGIACLAWLPEASVAWTIAPQLLAGVGMGMAFPALAGELLPERTRGQAAALLSLRHAGITVVLVALAPLVAAELDQQVDLARERGTALVLDAALPPTDKIQLAPRLFAGLDTEDPRDSLAAALARERGRIGRGDRDLLSRLERLEDQLREPGSDDPLGRLEERFGLDTDELLSGLERLEDRVGGDLAERLRDLEDQLGTDFGSDLLGDLERSLGGRTEPAELRVEVDRLANELDEVVLAAVDAAFSPALAVTGAMALLAALVLLPRAGPRRAGAPDAGLRGGAQHAGHGGGALRPGLRAGALGAALLLAIAVPVGYAVAERDLKPEPVEIADPCQDRERRSIGGVEGVAEGVALGALDRAACEFGSSREELVLALFDDESRRDYEREHGVDPRSLDAVLEGVVGL
jgi:MFS family permease